MTSSELRSEIEKALRDLVPEGTRFWFTGLPITPIITAVDGEAVSVDIHIGACRYIEGASFVESLEKALKQAVPDLKTVICSFTEV